MEKKQSLILVSACLTGLCTRYDAQLKESRACLAELRENTWIPFCPEQLGGLPTPREAADLHDGNGHQVLAGKARVLTQNGSDVTSEFIKGAQQALKIAQDQNISTAFLKARSPSCGVTDIMGVTAALFQQHGIKLFEY